VSQLAAKTQLDCYQSLAVDSVAQESAARIWRYSQFSRIASTHHYPILVTAHTASDRIETLLHHLLRGSGADGLQSFAWTRDLSKPVWISPDPDERIGKSYIFFKAIRSMQHDTLVEPKGHKRKTNLSLIRPLLSTTRHELCQLCEQWTIPVWSDPTNANLAFRRNHIRHLLLPYLKHHFEPRIDSVLARWAEIVHAESNYLDRIAIQICQREMKAAQSHDAWLLRADLIRALPLALQRRVLKRFVELLAGQSLPFSHIEHIRMLCLGHRTTRRERRLSQNGEESTLARPAHTGIAFPGNARLQLVSHTLVGLVDSKGILRSSIGESESISDSHHIA
jgi:tRNA(Ile)-lysidine synthase